MADVGYIKTSHRSTRRNIPAVCLWRRSGLNLPAGGYRCRHRMHGCTRRRTISGSFAGVTLEGDEVTIEGNSHPDHQADNRTDGTIVPQQDDGAGFSKK